MPLIIRMGGLPSLRKYLYNKQSLQSLLVRESRLCVFTSGSFAWHHFQLYDIDSSFLFALGAIEWEMHKNRFPIDFDSTLAAANRAANPKRIVRCLIHRNSSEIKWFCVNRLAPIKQLAMISSKSGDSTCEDCFHT